jgi:nitrous oxidase accessory protein NosD
LAQAKPANAQTFEPITIKADGTIDPPTASLTKTENVYKLTDNIFGNIKVEKFNIVLDGAGFSLQGNGTALGIQIFNPSNATTVNSLDVTVKDFKIKGFNKGIVVLGYGGNNISGVSIEGNTIANNNVGIYFSSYGRYSSNTIIGNNIIGNNQGIALQMGHGGDEKGNIISFNQIVQNQVGMYFLWMGDYYSWKPNPFQMNNQIYNNNFIENSQNVFNGHVIYDPDCANIWDNGSKGNYWGDYNGTDSNGDGIGDSNYTIDNNNLDHYPLVSLVVDSPMPILPSPSPTVTPKENEQTLPFNTMFMVAVSVTTGLVVSLGFLLFFKNKHRKRGAV